mgnify:FL=1
MTAALPIAPASDASLLVDYLINFVVHLNLNGATPSATLLHWPQYDESKQMLAFVDLPEIGRAHV